jgi:hypothetical protein
MALRGSYAGIHTRLVMVEGITAVQLVIYGDINKVRSMLCLRNALISFDDHRNRLLARLVGWRRNSLLSGGLE